MSRVQIYSEDNIVLGMQIINKEAIVAYPFFVVNDQGADDHGSCTMMYTSELRSKDMDLRMRGNQIERRDLP